MRKAVSLVTLAAFVFASIVTDVAPVLAQAAVKIAVLNLQANKGLDAMTMASLTELICTELSKYGGYEVMSRDDMQAMLQHIGDQQMLSCDDTQCLAKVGDALGVQRLLAGNIGMVGDRYLINLKLIDIENVKVLNRVSQEFAGDEGGLIDAIRAATAQLCGKAAPAAQPLVQVTVNAAAPPAGDSRCEVSRVQGMVDARKKSTANWFWGGLGCGCGLNLLGAAGLWYLAGNAENMPAPNAIPAEVNAACYIDGYTKALKSKKKSSACWGGIIGVIVGGAVGARLGLR